MLSNTPLPLRKLHSWVLTIVLFSCTVHVSAQCCEFSVRISDSYGDGWNGANVKVRVNGVLVGTYQANGTGAIGLFEACTGDMLQVNYTSGSYDEDNRYQVLGPNGNVIYADGPYPATGMVFSGPLDCAAMPSPGIMPCGALPVDTANCVLVNNTGVAGTGISPACAGYNGGDVWYTMPVPVSGNVVVSTSGTGDLNDTGIAIWTGPDCYNITLRGCDDDAGVDLFSSIAANELPYGDQLYIQVFGYAAASGAFELCVSDPGSIEVVSSPLPIVLINTLQQPIPLNSRIDALMEMKYNGPGQLNYMSDPSNEYIGNISIGIRGASSSTYPQKPYKLETRTPAGENNNVALLGMPAENDWVMLSNYNDRSLLRNSLASHLARQMGEYAPRSRLCELLINGQYRGIYLFGEKIKRDSERVAIAQLNPIEIAGDDVTGGYILEQNLRGWNDSFQSNFSPIGHPDKDVHFLYNTPDPDAIVPAQRTYIASFIDSLETALYGQNFTDPIEGYRKYLDVPSFITYFLVNELARNNDGFKKSVYFHKDKNSNGGKLKAGPVWDFDWAFKNIVECDIVNGVGGAGWSHRINDCPTDNNSTGWMIRLLQDSSFVNELRCTYDDHRNTILSTEALFTYIDSVGALVQDVQARHFQKWPILGVSGPAPERYGIATTYAAELDTLKAWIDQRLNWLDQNIPGTCLGVGVQDIATAASVRVFPNPSDGHFRLEGNLQGGSDHWLHITDMAGREVMRTLLPHGNLPVDVYVDRSGAYVYSLISNGQVVQRGKLVVF